MTVWIYADLNGSGAMTQLLPAASLGDALRLVEASVAANAGNTTSWRLELDSDVVEQCTAIDLGASSRTLVTVLPSEPASRRTVRAQGVFEWLEFRGDGAHLEFVKIDFELASILPVPSMGLIHVFARSALVLDSCSIRVHSSSIAFAHRGVVAEYSSAEPDRPVPGVQITLDNVLIEGLDVGVRMVGGRSFEAFDSAIVGAHDGLALVLVPRVRIQNCAFRECGTGLLQLTDYAALGTELVELKPEWEVGGLTLDSTVGDCRFTDCRRGLDLWHDGGNLHGKRYTILRCEFSAPTLDSGDRIGMRVRFRPGAEGGDPAQPSCVQIASSVFHHLVAGVEVLSTRTGRIWIDHNTFDLPEPGLNVRPRERAEFLGQPLENWSMGVAVRGSELPDWENRLPDAPLGYPLSRPPLLLITDNVFQTGAWTRSRVHPVLFGGAWGSIGLQGSQVVPLDPQNHPYSVLLAHNLLSSDWMPLSNLAMASDLVVGIFSMDAFQLGQPFVGPWANRLGDAKLARPPALEAQAATWDFHPVRSLDSDAVALGSLPPYQRGLVALWGYPIPARTGFYGNQPVVPGVADPPRQAIGAAEPAGWAEWPIVFFGGGVSMFAAGRGDIVVVGGVLQKVPAPTSDPVQSGWDLFDGTMQEGWADNAVSAGLKLAVKLSLHGPPEGVPTPPGVPWEFPTSLQAGSIDAFGGYLDYWIDAAQEFLRQLWARPKMRGATAFIWGPEEPDANLHGFQAGGLPRSYGAAVRLRQFIDSEGPVGSRFLTYQDNAHGVADNLLAVRVGVVMVNLFDDAPTTGGLLDAGEATVDLLPISSLWTERFNEGQEQSSPGVPIPGVPASVCRDTDHDPAAGRPLTTSTDPPNATEAGYGTVLSPLLDPLGFLAPVYDGLLVGMYWQRVQGAAQVHGLAPAIAVNRLYIHQRMRGLLEADANAEYLAQEHSQTIGGGPVFLGLELVHGKDDRDTEDASDDLYRVSPDTAAHAAHDMLLGLQSATGFFLFSPADRAWLDTNQDWVDWAGTPVPSTTNGDHPAWPGYEAILLLLKSELREFLVCGDREFDLGFEIVDPSDPEDEKVLGSYWGDRIGFVQEWSRTNHLVLRVRNRVYLIVTRSEDRDAPPQRLSTTFEFGQASLGVATTATVLWPPGSTVQAATGGNYLFRDTIEHVGARVYRIDLP